MKPAVVDNWEGEARLLAQQRIVRARDVSIQDDPST
jgi:hypothetical protein